MVNDKYLEERMLNCVFATKGVGGAITRMRGAIDEKDIDETIYSGAWAIQMLQDQLNCGYEGASDHIANITMAMRKAALGSWTGEDSAEYYLALVADAYYISPGIPPFRF
jgi:hypothetical protein